MILYVIWLLSFTALIFTTRQSLQMFQFTDLWRTKALQTINTQYLVAEDFWTFVLTDLTNIVSPDSDFGDEYQLSTRPCDL